MYQPMQAYIFNCKYMYLRYFKYLLLCAEHRLQRKFIHHALSYIVAKIIY